MLLKTYSDRIHCVEMNIIDKNHILNYPIKGFSQKYTIYVII